MPGPTLDLTRPQETRGRPLNKKLIVVGGLIVLVVVITVLWPAIVRPPRTKSAPQAPVVQVKDSKVLKTLPSSHVGDALNGETATTQAAQLLASHQAAPHGDDSEATRLRAENDQLRELLKRSGTKTETSGQPKPKVVDPEVKSREAERKREILENRTLVMRKAPPPKDGSQKLMALQHPLTPYTITPLWKIPCQTEGPSSNEAPGIVTVRVKQRVLDSATGTHLLIPQETLMGLRPSGRIIAGDSRIPFDAMMMTFPNGTWTKPPAATLADQAGLAGLTGDIDRHWFRLAGSVFLTSVLQGGTTIANTTSGDPTGRVTGQVANNMSSEAQRELRQSLRTDPTISVPPGTGCLLELEDPLSFAKPYPF